MTDLRHRVSLVLVLVIAGLALAVAQTPQMFEVASVRKSQPPAGSMRINLGSRQGDRWLAQNATLRLLLRSAYATQFSMDGQIVGGPPWIDTDRFDVEATMASGTSNEDMRVMIRALLVDRFQLKVHTERRDLPVFALTVARGDGKPDGQMRPVAVDCDAVRAARTKGEKPASGPAGAQVACSTSMMLGPATRIETSGMNMASLAQTLSTASGRPVFDRTGLSGWFAFTLRFATEPGATTPAGGPPQGLSPDPVDAPSLSAALQDQLGLRIESRREPVEVLVVESASQPGDN